MATKHNWRKVKAWRSHSVACWDAEWVEWKRAAEAQGKSVNGWIREWLQEAVKYERLQLQDVAHEDRGRTA